MSPLRPARGGALAAGSVLALVLSAVGFAPPAVAAPASESPLRAIAIAEDRRQWSDGVLRGFLTHDDPRVRARAVRAVGRLQDSTAVPSLLPRLRDASAEVRRETVFALGQIGARAARAPVESLLAAGDVELVELSLEALGKIGDRAASPMVARFLGSALPRLRGEAAVALWRLADSTALDALIERHSDPDPEVRWRVLYALEKIVDPDRIVLIAALHVEDADWMVRAQAVRTMGRQRSARATAYVVQRLDDPEPAVIVNALRALQQIADSTCGGCTTDVLGVLSHGNPYVRVTAATVLGERFLPAATTDSVLRATVIDTLVRRLADTDAATRGAAARALIAWRGPEAMVQLEPLLADSSIYTRVAVLQALTRLPADRVVPLLMARLQPGAPLFERMTAAEALGTLRARGALAELRAGLADTSVLYVAAVAGAIAELGDSASVRMLARAYAAHAGDADADARISIRDALRGLAGAAFADSVVAKSPATNAAPATYPPDFQDPPAERGAVIHTSAGDIEWAFEGAEAPQTVKNFVRLARRGYFDGAAIHRVVPHFVIQDGDPTGTGSGGPGYTIRCEYNRLRYDAGRVGMALSGKDTGGSQWFITHAPQPHLNGRYTIFARVTRGMDVVQRVVQGDRVVRVEILP